MNKRMYNYKLLYEDGQHFIGMVRLVSWQTQQPESKCIQFYKLIASLLQERTVLRK